MISHHCNFFNMTEFLIKSWFFSSIFPGYSQPIWQHFSHPIPIPKCQPCLFEGIGEIHSTIPVVAITTKLDLMPQDLVAGRAAQVSYGLWLVPTIMVVALIILICVAIVLCKRRVQHGGMCYICGA